MDDFAALLLAGSQLIPILTDKRINSILHALQRAPVSTDSMWGTSMNPKWKSVIEKFLTSLEATQTELKTLYQKRKAALIGGDLERMNELQNEEQRITNQFQQLLKVREQILKSAIHEGFEGSTLKELVETSEDENLFLLNRIKKSEEQTETLRQESWVQWIIANRNYQYVTDVISLIAHKGQKPLTYNEQDSNQSTGGTFLDASA